MLGKSRCLIRFLHDVQNSDISVRLMLQNADLLEEARAARIYKDELDIFREKVRRFTVQHCDRFVFFDQ